MTSELARRDWVGEYAQSHTHPTNRLLHSFGIPMIALSVILGGASISVRKARAPALALFLTGWGLQFIGHAVEGKPPEFLKDWRFLFVGLRWWAAKMAGRA